MGTHTGGDVVYDALVDAGVELLIGLPGTQTLPLDRIVAERDEMKYVMARHETAIPHIAWGYYETSQKPVATLTVPGPGDTNAMHGLKNAYEDCVPIIHVSADRNPADRGKGPIHSIDPKTFDTVVKENINIESALELPEMVEKGIQTAFTEPYGPVRLGVPSNVLAAEVGSTDVDCSPTRCSYSDSTGLAEASSRLANAERPLVYAGGGTRRSSDGTRIVRELAEALDAPVLTSNKGKGVFPEDDDRWLGVTGSHLPAGAVEVLEAADLVVALGTDLDGVSTDSWEHPMGASLVHVNLNPRDMNRGYEADVVLVGDVTEVGEKLLRGLAESSQSVDRWNGGEIALRVRAEYQNHLRELGLFAGETPARTPELLREVRGAIPNNTVVTTDVGGFRLWAMQLFGCYSPDQFVTSGSWAGMGVGLPGAVGAALADGDQPVVCLTGDGGLLMCLQELHTAVEEGLDITVVISNNSDYGIISKSPKIETEGDGNEFTWESPNFVSLANGFGCRALRVETAAGAGEAVADAIDRDGPTLVEVTVDTYEPSSPRAAEYESGIEIAPASR